MRSFRIRRFFFAALIFSACAFVASAATPALAQSTGRLEGILTVVWGDPPPGMPGGAVRFTLTLPDGTAYPLQIGVAQRNFAIRNFGKPVVVQGRKMIDASGRRVVAVSRLTPGVQGMRPELPA